MWCKEWEWVSLGILIPSGPHWHAKFGMSLVGATAHFFNTKLPNCRGVQGYFISNKRGSILPQLREELVESALVRPEVTHLLFVDSDETFPADAFWRLVSHGRRVVGAAFPTKMTGGVWTAYKKDGKNGDFRPIAMSPSMPDLIRVDRIGTGMLLVEADIFRSLPKPWFSLANRGGRWVGEDWWLCERLQEADIPIWVDTALSLQVGHVGEYEYTSKDIACDKGTSD